MIFCDLWINITSPHINLFILTSNYCLHNQCICAISDLWISDPFDLRVLFEQGVKGHLGNLAGEGHVLVGYAF